MRILKLSVQKEFHTLHELRDYFQRELYARDPEGKFLVPSKKLIEKNELLMFSYKKIVRYTAIAKTGILPNHDELAKKYPYYFLIDMSSLEDAKYTISLEQVEDLLKDVYGKSIATGQTWSKIPDLPTTIELWESLRNS